MPKILHFENEKFLRDAFQFKFTQNGFECVGYDNPTTDPVSLVLREKPDLIVTDIIMPVMDGLRATALLKADERTKDIPILGLSNLGQAVDVRQALEVEMTDYLIKAHTTPNDLIKRIREILESLTVSNDQPHPH